MFTVWKASKLNSDWYLEVTLKKKKKKENHIVLSV